MTIDERAGIGELVKIDRKFYKEFMKRFGVTKQVISKPFKILKRDSSVISVRSLENNKKYQLPFGIYSSATFANYKNNLKQAWSEDVDTKKKRVTVKEVFRWFKGLEENKWRKTYPIDARRISYFVNNSGLNEVDRAEMPKSLKKKNPDATYVREQKFAKRFMEYKEESNKLEESVRSEIRSILAEDFNDDQVGEYVNNVAELKQAAGNVNMDKVEEYAKKYYRSVIGANKHGYIQHLTKLFKKLK